MQALQMHFTQFTGLAGRKSMVAAPAPQPAAAFTRIGAPQRLTVEARTMTRRAQLEKRHKRVRGRVSGTTDRPRLAIFRSNSHIYAQVVDDEEGSTLVAASTLTPEIREALGAAGSNNEEAAKLVGSKIAELCKQKNIEKVCFDRGGFRYHGRVQALADAAREGGLAF